MIARDVRLYSPPPVSEKEIRKMVTVGDVVQVIQALKNKLVRNNKNPQ